MLTQTVGGREHSNLADNTVLTLLKIGRGFKLDWRPRWKPCLVSMLHHVWDDGWYIYIPNCSHTLSFYSKSPINLLKIRKNSEKIGRNYIKLYNKIETDSEQSELTDNTTCCYMDSCRKRV